MAYEFPKIDQAGLITKMLAKEMGFVRAKARQGRQGGNGTREPFIYFAPPTVLVSSSVLSLQNANDCNHAPLYNFGLGLDMYKNYAGVPVGYHCYLLGLEISRWGFPPVRSTNL